MRRRWGVQAGVNSQPTAGFTANVGYGLDEYVPRLVRDGWCDARYRSVEGTLVFADISGFTNLSERLARSGRAGAEELVTAISSVFTPLIDDIVAVGGDVLKFGGDALLFLVTGEEHAARAVSAAVAMRATLRRVGVISTGTGTVRLRMSVGVHSGTFECLLVGRDHEELVIVGPAASTTVLMESTADAGEILVSADTASQIPTACIGAAKGQGWLVKRRPHRVPDVGRSTAAAASEIFVPIALRGRLAAIVAESEHRYVTVAFLHFGGVDELLARAGLAETHRRINELAATVVEICEQLDVTIICTDIADDGGKFMLACGAPDAVDDAEGRMLRACRGILDRDHGLPVRIGVNRGPVYAGAVGSPRRFTYSTMGDAVNLAARVMGKARPGQVLATASVVDNCGRRFDLAPLEPFMVKGKSQPVRAYAVGRVRHGQSTLRPGAAEFIGRTSELALLRDRATAAASGRGAAVEIVADTGMGKSQLVAEATATWVHRRIEVACEQYDSATPYFATRQLLRAALGIDDVADRAAAGRALERAVSEAVPALARWTPLIAIAIDAEVDMTEDVAQLAAQFRRARLAELTVELLDAVVREPLLLVVEDGFWMDDASAEVIAAVVRAAAARAWLVLVTTRPNQSSGMSRLDGVAISIELGPLRRDDAAEIFRSVVGRWPSPHVLDELVARAGGNPLFTVELASVIGRDGLDAVPPSIEGLVSAHLDRLDVEDRRCLRYASVAGTTTSLDLLERAIGDLVPSLADAHQLERLREFVEVGDDGVFTFRHDLYRRVAYEALPFRRRRELHGRIADAIVAEHGDEPDVLPLLSMHYREAQRLPETWRYSVLAGARATEQYAPVEAARFYERALHVAPKLGVPAEEVCTVAQALGDAHRLAAQYDQATRAYKEARRSAGDVIATAEVMLREGVVRERMGRYKAAVRWYLRALRTLPSGPESRVRSLEAQLSVELAAARYRQGRLQECIDACLSSIAAAEGANDRDALAHAYYLLDAAYTDLGHPDSRRYRELALPIYRELGDLVGEADVLNNLGIDAYYEGDLDEALAYYEKCRAVRTRAGDVMGAAVAANNIGEVYSDVGRLDDAARLFDDALRVFEAVDYPIGIALVRGNLGLLAARAGRADEARALLVEAKARFAALGATPYVAEMEDRLGRIDEALV